MCPPYVPLHAHPLSSNILFVVATDWSRSEHLWDKAVSARSISAKQRDSLTVLAQSRSLVKSYAIKDRKR
jgi:hypothetical protein